MAEKTQETIVIGGGDDDHGEGTYKEMLRGGHAAAEREVNQTLWEALKEQWRAVLWSFCLSLSVVMVGYDSSLTSNFYGYPTFQRKYGQYFGPDIGYQLSAPWQTGLGNATTVGTIFGALLNGVLSSWFGYRRVMLVALVAMIGIVFITFFAPNVQTLLVANLLNGFPWGVFTTVGQAYASEVCPVKLRGFLTSYVNLCQIIGQFVSIAVLEGLIDRTDKWSYKIPYALQWIWPLPLLVGVLFAPDSPWWLVRKGRRDDAFKALMRLSNGREDECRDTLHMIEHTVEYEREAQSGTSYWDCFRGSNLRRTEIATTVFIGQVTCGIAMMDPGTYFWEQAGLSAKSSYKVSVGAAAIGFLATIVGSFLIARFGRRALYVWGMLGLVVLLLLIGIVSVTTSNSAGRWSQVALTIAWTALYNFTLGPSAYAASSESSAMALRAHTVALSKVVHQLADVVSGVLEPYMLNPSKWNWAGKTAFFWAGTAFLTAVWAYYRLPETKDRTYEELDILFDNKISPRKFTKYKISSYGETVILEDDEGNQIRGLTMTGEFLNE